MFYEVTLTEDGRVEAITFAGESSKTIELGSRKIEMPLAKSAIGAATGFFFFGDYDNPETVPGLHLYANPVKADALIELVGYVHATYAGGDYPLPDTDVFPLGWAPLVKRNGLITLGTFTRESWERENKTPMGRSSHAWNVANKHDVIDQFVLGHTVKVRTLAFQDLVMKHMSIWAEEDLDTARELSNEAYYGRVNLRKTTRKAYQHSQKVEAGKAAPKSNGGNSLLMRTVGGDTVNLFDLGSQSLQVCDHNARGPFQGIFWNPESRTSKEQFEFLAEKNYCIRLG